MNLEELRALTPEQRDAVLAKQCESLTPVDRVAVHLNLDFHHDESDALLLLDNLMSRICAADPATLTEDALAFQGELVEVIESWLPPSHFISDEDYRPAWIAAMAERDAEIRETDALKVRLVEAAKEIRDLHKIVSDARHALSVFRPLIPVAAFDELEESLNPTHL